MNSSGKRTPTKPPVKSQTTKTTSTPTKQLTPKSSISKLTQSKVSSSTKTPVKSTLNSTPRSSRVTAVKDSSDLLLTPPINKNRTPKSTNPQSRIQLNFDSPTLGNEFQQELNSLIEDELSQSLFQDFNNGANNVTNSNINNNNNNNNINKSLSEGANVKDNINKNISQLNNHFDNKNNNNNNNLQDNKNNNNNNVQDNKTVTQNKDHQVNEQFSEQVDAKQNNNINNNNNNNDNNDNNNNNGSNENNSGDINNGSFTNLSNLPANGDIKNEIFIHDTDSEEDDLDNIQTQPNNNADEISETGSVGSMYSDGFSYLHQVLRLEGELKSKQHQLSGLIQETARLERSLGKKAETLFELNAALHKSQESILRYEEEAKGKEEVIQSLSKQMKGLKEEIENLQNQVKNLTATNVTLLANQNTKPPVHRKNKERSSAIRKLDIEIQILKNYQSKNSKVRRGSSNNSINNNNGDFDQFELLENLDIASLNSDLIQDLYHHVNLLDNQLTEKEKKIHDLETLFVENERRNKELEMIYQKTSKEFIKYKENAENELLEVKRTLVEKITLLTKRENNLSAQHKRLEEETRYKDQEIKNLQEILNKLKETKSNHYEKKIQLLEKRLNETNKQNEQLKNNIECKDKLVTKYTKQIREKSGFNFNSWVEDKKYLGKKVETLKIQNDAYLRTIDAQKTRILQLCDRIDLIASSLQNANQKKFSKVNLKNLSRLSLGREINNNINNQSPLSNSFNIIEELSDEEAELTDDLLDDLNDFSDQYQEETDTESAISQSDVRSISSKDGEVTGDKIPIQIYELIEQEVVKLKRKLQQKDKLLEEKDAQLQVIFIYLYFIAFY